MKNIFPFLFAALVVFSACKKEELKPEPHTPVTPPPAIEVAKAVDLSNPKAGQVSYFKQYMNSCGFQYADFRYTDNIMTLEVIEIDGQLHFKESFTESSPLKELQPEPVIYPVYEAGEDLLIPQRTQSALFFFYGNDTIRLNPANRTPLDQVDCELFIDSDPFIGNEVGLVSSFEVGPIKMENKTAVSCVPVMMEMDAYLIYDGTQLHMSHIVSTTPGVFSSQRGWVLIEP